MNKDVVNELLDLVINQTKSGILRWTEQDRKYTSNDGRLTMTKTIVLERRFFRKDLRFESIHLNTTEFEYSTIPTRYAKGTEEFINGGSSIKKLQELFALVCEKAVNFYDLKAQELIRRMRGIAK
jgi:hypothetical protein